ncbi:MAG: hypothetical protein DWQ34_19255 [Planctomycetota bacterium]|nr:MAG: hypothetical protein DWQ29_12020 [Planctomycetota bacterium]REJ89659.1 MAG: hypothetical protein DWQ34_19255 [Planctomycetota bacterium]REK24370.1 MAG: hypothetical protein DWQ41_15225 [Planctomycetota bacterium]REK38561.1 MAG: hypothetical protein DWQ45_04020 [Planctomycetota bacterium]
MKKTDLSRRDFNRLSAAAFGGVVAGTLAGCPGGGDDATESPSPEDGPESTDASGGDDAAAAEPDVAYLLEEPHVCRGLNTCENLGKSGENACAGQGTCHSVPEQTCGGDNACKGQGGCGEYPGQNGCKGQGACHVPLMDDAWEKARAAFEKAMEEAGRTVGPAPEAGAA